MGAGTSDTGPGRAQPTPRRDPMWTNVRPKEILSLALAGAADAVSGVFRATIWNETIPTELRGRLAGVEMISYLSGPLLGNARAGWVATISSNNISVVSGGFICLVAVLLCIPLLPAFWNYRAERRVSKPVSVSSGATVP